MKTSSRDKHNTNDRLLFILGTFDVGGAEMFAMNLLRAGEQFDAACVIPDKGAYEDEMNRRECRTYHMTRRSVSIFRHHLDLYHIIHDNGYQTVYFHTQNAFLTSMHVFVARLAGAKTIAVHSHNTKDWRTGKSVNLHRYFRKWLYRHSDIRLACGKDAAKWLFGTDRDVYILPLPVNCDAFQYSDTKREAARKELGIPYDTEVYLHVGRFDTVKNHTFLLDVFKDICRLNEQSGKESVLLLAGAGELMDEMKRKSEHLEIQDKVRFFGITDKVPELAVASDKMIFPSLYEGFPTVLLEAQAAGLPCFISDTIDKDIAVSGKNVHFLSLNQSSMEWAEYIVRTSSNSNSKKLQIGNEIRQKYDIFAVKETLHKILYDSMQAEK